jgi:hypothetical protein
MNRAQDPRNAEQCLYTQAHLIWLGIMLFMQHLGSRRQLRFERSSDIFEKNLSRLAGEQIAGFMERREEIRVTYQAFDGRRSEYTLRPFHLPAYHGTGTCLRGTRQGASRDVCNLPVPAD